MQAAFCIDVRSEVFRRAFEAQDAAIDTIGFAGFFGLPLAHRPHGTDQTQIHLPVPSDPRADRLQPIAAPKAEEDRPRHRRAGRRGLGAGFPAGRRCHPLPSRRIRWPLFMAEKLVQKGVAMGL